MKASLVLFVVFAAMVKVATVSAAEFPACIAESGQSVGVYQTTSTEGGPAFATIANGKPVIVFNEQLMSEYAHSSETRLFIYFHECGHQALGHTTDATKTRKHTNEEELAADCYAAQQLKAMGMSQERFDLVLTDLKLLRKDPDHPGHVKRISNVIECFGE